MKFLFIQKTSLQVHDIWKDGEVLQWLLSPFNQQSFQELIFKAFKNYKHIGCDDFQQVRSIDWNEYYC